MRSVHLIDSACRVLVLPLKKIHFFSPCLRSGGKKCFISTNSHVVRRDFRRIVERIMVAFETRMAAEPGDSSTTLLPKFSVTFEDYAGLDTLIYIFVDLFLILDSINIFFYFLVSSDSLILIYVSGMITTT